jgi:hypothetical protein
VHVVIDRETYEFPVGWSVLDGSMTRRTKDNELRPADFLDVSSDDAKRLDVYDSDVVQRESVRVCDASGPAEYREYSSTRLPDRIATRQPARRSTR